MDAGTDPASTPRNTDHDTAVEVAVAIVVDKLSAQNAAQTRPDAALDAGGIDRVGLSVLISLRKAEQVLGGLWELPGGKVEPGESPADAAVRELREEVGIDAEPIHPLSIVEHTYDHARVRLHPFICRHLAGTPSAIEVDAVRWVTIGQLADYTFPDASHPVLDAFLNWLKTKQQTI